MAAPVSNGAVVTDETPTSSVHVNFNFSNTGSGGVLQVLQSEQLYSISSGFPAANDGGWVDAVDVSGNAPTSGAQSATWSHYGFTQARGTKLYYYCRRKNGSTIELGSPYPVAEIVPSQPYVNDITHNAAFTTATVSSHVSDSYTTLYYHQNTTGTQPVWEAQSPTQTAPDPSVWQTSATFSTTPDVSYYYYVLGWTHNNPAEDGAAISPAVSRNAGDVYGLEVWNANGTRIISPSDRLARFVTSGTAVVAKNGSTNVTVTGMANNDSWTVILGMPPNLLWSTEAQFVKANGYIQISYPQQTQYFGISSPSTVTVTYYVFRT